MKELTIKEKQEIILEIMIDIDKFCRENDIPYTLSSGTLLGAVRHGGFIPWDDDADLFMLREDFDRFVEIYRSPRYHLLYNTRNDKEFLASCYAKVSDPSTCVDNKKSLTNYGVYVDIFPLESVPEDPKERHEYMHRIMSTYNRLHHRQKKDIVSIIKSYRHPIDWWWNRCNELVHEGKYRDSPLAAHAIGTNNYRTVIEKKRFESLADIDFEGHRFLGFSDPHSYLEMVYGSDYMTPKRWAHNYTIYRAEDMQDAVPEGGYGCLRRFFRRLAQQGMLIIKGHILNWPWRSRTERRRVRYKATQESALWYLSRYIPFIKAVRPAPQDTSGSEPERVFTIWLQGEENAPGIVKSCFRSMRRHLKQELVILDEKTLFDWISLPQYVLDKWHAGKMRPAHFCDICRVELIYSHGGVWIDSTGFVTAPIPDTVMNEDFFIYMSGSRIRGSYSFVQNCFFRARKHNPLLGVWREAILRYWKDEDRVINYFTHQLLFKLSAENNPVAAGLFAKMPKYEQDPTHALWDSHKNEPYDGQAFESMTAGAFFQKTEYKSDDSKNPRPGSFADVLTNM